ncbi:MAG: Dabb family protein [Ruthenibacterium sp.]
MIRHIVLWNLKEKAEEGTREQNAAVIKSRLEALVGQIDGLQTLTVARGIVEGGYDLCLYSEFTDLSALLFYRAHPLHREVQKFVHAVITDRVSCDTEI